MYRASGSYKGALNPFYTAAFCFINNYWTGFFLPWRKSSKWTRFQHYQGLTITLRHTTHGRTLSGRGISWKQRPLSDNTEHSQQTAIHAPGGIRTSNPNSWVDPESRFRPRGHWDRNGTTIWPCTPWSSDSIARSKRDGTCAETRLRLSAKWKSPFKSTGVSVQSTTGSRGVQISGQRLYRTCSDVQCKAVGYPLHSHLSPSLPLPCFTVCHQVMNALYQLNKKQVNLEKLVDDTCQYAMTTTFHKCT